MKLGNRVILIEAKNLAGCLQGRSLGSESQDDGDMLRKYFLLPFAFAIAIVSCEPIPIPTATAPTPMTQPTATQTSEAATPTPTSLAANPVEIQFWHAQPQQAALNGLIDKFNASHPDSRIIAIYQGTYTNLLRNAQSGNTAPDLMLAYPSDIANLIRAGEIAPLDDLMKDPKVGFSADDLKDIFPAFIDRYAQFGNKVYSIGFMRGMQVLYYNADLLKAAGLKPPETWDDFLKACAALSKQPDVICYEMDPNAYDVSAWLLNRGGNLFNADGKKVAFDQKPGLDTFMFVNDLLAKKYGVVTSKPFQDQTDFALGKAVFTFDTTLGLPFYDKAIKNSGKNINWGIALSPRTIPSPIAFVYGPSLAIFKSTPEKHQAAFVFLRWMMENESNAGWARSTYYFPARQSTKGPLTDFVKANPLYGQAFDWLKFARGEPTIAGWSSIRGIIADAVVQVANGKAAPADALKDAAAKANVVLGQ